MKLKISLKTGSRDEAVNLGKKILKDVNPRMAHMGIP